MMCCYLIFGFLALLGCKNIEGYNTEAIYEYTGDVRVGGNFPPHYVSQFGIKAMLKVQTETASKKIFQFSDVKYQVSTGLLSESESSKAKFIPSPTKTDSLKQPFQVIYEDGKTTSILTMDEPEWSINIKKSIATTFQLDIPNLHFNESYSFITNEETLHGKCSIGYTVQPKGEGYVDVIKNQEYRKCENIPQRHFTSILCEDCPLVNNDDTFLQGSTKFYKLFIGNQNIEFKKIFSQSVTAAVPFSGRENNQAILIRQNITFLSSGTAEEPVILEPKHEIKNMKFVIPDYYNEMGTLSDLTGGHHIVIKSDVMKAAHKTLEDLVDFIMMMEISKKPWKLNVSMSQLLLYYFGKLDQECLTHCFEKYINATTTREENLRETFLHIAAQVGSKASILFIKDVILSKKIPENLACEINYLVPFYIRDPNLMILEEYEALLSADVSKKVHKVIVLSISNLAFMTYKKIHDEDIINKYANNFYQSFKDDSDYGNKLNYLSALTNLKEGKAFDYLVEIANDKTYSPNLRYLALWGTKTEATKNPSKCYNLYWPILSDKYEEIDMRAAAMKLIMLTEPTIDRFLSIFWFMQAETNSQLYYFFYTGMESFSKTKHPCYKMIGNHAKRLLRYAKKPITTHLFTGDFILENTDHKQTLSGYLLFSLIGDFKTGSPSNIYASLGGYYGGYSNYNFGVSVKVNGLTEHFKSYMIPYNVEKLMLGDLEKILSFINTKPISDVPNTIEVVYYANNHVYATQYLDENRSQQSTNETKNPNRKLWNYHKLILTGVHEFIQPTDIGIPAIWSMAVPHLFSLVSNTSHNKTGRMSRLDYDTKIRFGYYGSQSLSFYNPLGEMWQGAHHTTSQFYNIPIYGYFRTEFGTFFKFASIRNPESNLNLGVVHHTQNQVFVSEFSKNNTLKESCSTCSPYVMVHSVENPKEQNLIEYDSQNTGLKVMLDVFDCDKTLTLNDLASILHEDTGNHRRNPMIRLLHDALKLSSFKFHPDIGSCGVILNALPSKKYPYNQIEGDIQLAFGAENEDSIYEIVDKFYFFGSFSVKENENDNGNQNYNYFVDLTQSRDRINNSLNVELTHSALNQKDFKICIETEHTYPKIPHDTMVIRKESEEEVTGKLTMIWGESIDGKCPTEGIGFELSMTASVSPTEEIKNISVYPYNICHLESEEKEWKGKSITPETQACFRSAYEATTLRKFSGDIKYFNITNEFAEYGNKFLKLLQTAEHLISHDNKKYSNSIDKVIFNETNQLDENHGEIKYRIEFEKDKFHLSWEGHGHRQIYERNYGELGLKPYLRSSRFFLLMNIGYDIGYVSSCIVTPSSVLTFDNDTYHYKSSNCYTLVSADCSTNPTYAIFTKKIEGIYDLALKYYVGGNYLEIIPNAVGDFEMQINGYPIPSDVQHGYKYPPDAIDSYYFRLIKNDRFIKIDTSIYLIDINYNGHSVSITIQGPLRGSTCGLCGDFNGNKIYNERIGKDYICPGGNYDTVKGEFLGYRYTNKTEECQEITEEMMKKIECVEYRH